MLHWTRQLSDSIRAVEGPKVGIPQTLYDNRWWFAVAAALGAFGVIGYIMQRLAPLL